MKNAIFEGAKRILQKSGVDFYDFFIHFWVIFHFTELFGFESEGATKFDNTGK